MGKSVEELALLGDIASQNEVSEKGKLLPCPFCGGNVYCFIRIIVNLFDYWFVIFSQMC